MPASGTIDEVGGVDRFAAFCVAIIEGRYPGPKSYCPKVTLQWGPEPGVAECILPLNQLDGGPSINPIACNRASLVERIRDGDLAVVMAHLNPKADGVFNPADPTVCLLAGTVRNIRRDITFDTGRLLIKDHRYLLAGVPVIGSWWAELIGDENGPFVSYTHRKAHLNPNNQPNCIWAQVTGIVSGQTYLIPVFCPPFFGNDSSLTNEGSTIPTPDERDMDKACYWFPETYAMNLRWHTSADARALAQELGPGKFDEYPIIPDLVIWPYSLPSALLDFQAVGRKAFERVYHCHSVIHILDDLCRASGPYAPIMFSNDDGTNTLGIVRTRYIGPDGTSELSATAEQGLRLKMVQGGQAADDISGPFINGGEFTESSENLYPLIIPVGDHPYIEARCASTRDNSEAELEDQYVFLCWAFAEADRAAAENAITQALNGGLDPVNFMPAIMRQFDVCGAWMVQPGFDFQAGTNQEGFPVARIGRAPLPHLLSSYVPSAASDEFAKQNSRYPITVEVNKTDDDTSWEILGCSGVEITGDGLISLRAIRDEDAEAGVLRGRLYTCRKLGDAPGRFTADLKPVRVRMTLAIPCDHRVTTPVALPGAGVDSTVLGEMDTDDTGRMNFDHGVRAMAIDTGQLLASEERSETFPPYPIPQSLKRGTDNEGVFQEGVNYPAAGAEEGDDIFGDAIVLRDDSENGYNHANRKLREFGRLDKSGEFPSVGLDLMAQPGDMIDAIEKTDGTDYPVKAVRKQVVHDFKGAPLQETRCQLA